MEKEYYLATKDERGDFLIYTSDPYKFSELDIINLIKICFVELRSKTLGKRFLEAYRDSTEHMKKIAEEKLKLIGINGNGDRKPIVKKKPKLK